MQMIWDECIGKWFNEKVKVNGEKGVVKCFEFLMQ